MYLKKVKDIIINMENLHNSRWNWYSKGKEPQDEPCYQGKFWDHTKKDFVSWKEVIKKEDG